MGRQGITQTSSWYDACLTILLLVETRGKVYGRKEDVNGRTVFREDGPHKRAIWLKSVIELKQWLLTSSQVCERSDHTEGEREQKKIFRWQDSGNNMSIVSNKSDETEICKYEQYWNSFLLLRQLPGAIKT